MRHHRGQNIVDSDNGKLANQIARVAAVVLLLLVCIYKYTILPTKNITMESPSILNFQQELQLLTYVNSKLIKTCQCATNEAVPKAY